MENEKNEFMPNSKEMFQQNIICAMVGSTGSGKSF